MVGLEIVRRRILTRLRVAVHDSEFVGTMVQSVMVCYALAVAWIAIKVWETHGATSQVVSTEAAATAGFWRDVSNHPEPVRTQLQDGVRDYVEFVVHQAWPLQRMGKPPAGGVEVVDRIQRVLAGFEPTTEGQKAFHQEAWRAYNRLIEVRRLRLDAVGNGLPWAMWSVVILAMDRPFRGDLGIGPESFQLVYDQLMKR